LIHKLKTVQLSFPYSVHKIYFCLLLSVWFNFDAGQDIRCFKLCTLGIVLFVNFLIYRVSEPYDKNRADVLPRHRIPFTVPSIVKWHNNMSIHVTGVETGKYHQGKHILAFTYLFNACADLKHLAGGFLRR